MQCMLGPLQTAAGGANRPESLSRSLRLTGECRPLLASDRTAVKGTTCGAKNVDKLRHVIPLSDIEKQKCCSLIGT